MDLKAVHQGVTRLKRKKRVGRGPGSGHGKTGTRGSKGQYASAGAEMFGPFFVGGQTPLYRRSPKRGFSRGAHATPHLEINVGDIDANFDSGANVTLADLKGKNVLKGIPTVLRVLGHGDVKKALTVHAHHFTASAKDKIEKAGGKVHLIPGPKKPVRNKMKPRKPKEA
ncbi:MAG: 50S ribosomal protein L15 [Gemmataceae bacterium]|nr:50S ribosomal protein L15 [Gemmataceae bacterium]